MNKKVDLVHPEISYKLVGMAFNVHNKIGGGLREAAYESAFAEALKRSSVQYERQINAPIKYLDKKVANRFLDFLIENKVVVELKVGGKFLRKDIEQLYEYLKIANLKLGLIINFSKREVTFKRIVNLRRESVD